MAHECASFDDKAARELLRHFTATAPRLAKAHHVKRSGLPRSTATAPHPDRGTRAPDKVLLVTNTENDVAGAHGNDDAAQGAQPSLPLNESVTTLTPKAPAPAADPAERVDDLEPDDDDLDEIADEALIAAARRPNPKPRSEPFGLADWIWEQAFRRRLIPHERLGDRDRHVKADLAAAAWLLERGVSIELLESRVLRFLDARREHRVDAAPTARGLRRAWDAPFVRTEDPEWETGWMLETGERIRKRRAETIRGFTTLPTTERQAS